MKKFIIIISFIFLLFSCWLEKQYWEEKNKDIDKVNEKKENQENYILFWTYDEKWLDIKYEDKNIEKIKNFLHKKNLSWINLENIKWDIKDILLLIKNNINKDVELSITLKYSQLNDENLSILMNYDINKLWIMIKQDCSKKIKDYYVDKKLWEKIINRKVKKIWIKLACKNNIMEEWNLIIKDKEQFEKLKNDTNFEFSY